MRKLKTTSLDGAETTNSSKLITIRYGNNVGTARTNRNNNNNKRETGLPGVDDVHTGDG